MNNSIYIKNGKKIICAFGTGGGHMICGTACDLDDDDYYFYSTTTDRITCPDCIKHLKKYLKIAKLNNIK